QEHALARERDDSASLVEMKQFMNIKICGAHRSSGKASQLESSYYQFDSPSRLPEPLGPHKRLKTRPRWPWYCGCHMGLRSDKRAQPGRTYEHRALGDRQQPFEPAVFGAAPGDRESTRGVRALVRDRAGARRRLLQGHRLGDDRRVEHRDWRGGPRWTSQIPRLLPPRPLSPTPPPS